MNEFIYPGFEKLVLYYTTLFHNYSKEMLSIIRHRSFRFKAYLTFFFDTSDKGVTSKTHRAATYRIVVYNLAPCIETTSAWTWICTFLVDARSILSTVCTHYTLRPAGWRCSNIVSLARAHRMPINYATFTEWSTW